MLDNEKKSKRSKIIKVILILIVIALLVLGIIFILNKNSSKGNSIIDYKIEYEGYNYTLPKGWKKNDEYPNALNIYFKDTIDETLIQVGAVIVVKELTPNDPSIDDIFKDETYFKDKLEKKESLTKVGEAIIDKINDTPVITFPCEYGKSSKILISYMPAYDNNYYAIDLYSNLVKKEETTDFYNYDSPSIIANFLNTKEKVK